MKKIIIAIDSFKGCLTSAEAGKAAEKGIKSINPSCHTSVIPIADGGEGLLDVLITATKGKYITLSAHGPLMKMAKTHYGIRCMVLPYVTAGSQNPGQRELDFCIHYRYETQKAILSDIVASLYAQGYRKMVIINGHGGNTFKSMIRDLSLDYPDFLIASSEWFAFVPAKEYFDEPGDHADELETSVMMHYHPELVNLDEAGDGNYKKFASQMLNEKVAWIPRNWQNVSQDTGIGNPKKASAGKGKKYAEAVVAKYALLFEELVHKELY